MHLACVVSSLETGRHTKGKAWREVSKQNEERAKTNRCTYLFDARKGTVCTSGQSYRFQAFFEFLERERFTCAKHLMNLHCASLTLCRARESTHCDCDLVHFSLQAMRRKERAVASGEKYLLYGRLNLVEALTGIDSSY